MQNKLHFTLRTSHLTLALVTLALLSTLNLPLSTACAQGTAFTYQGRLNDGANPANGHYDLQFILFNVNQFGFPVGPILTNANITVNNGLFTATLDFGSNIFTGTNYWLDVSVRTNDGGAFTELLPRQPITPAPYAVFAENVSSGGLMAGTYGSAVTFNNAANNFTGNGSALTGVNAATLGGLSSANFWKLGGNAGANPTNGNFIGTTDNLPLELRVSGLRALRLEPTVNDANDSNIVNVINGSPANFVSQGVYGATIAGGGAQYYRSDSITNSVRGDFGTVGGGVGNSSGGFATVGGGEDNIASNRWATVSGGSDNTATGGYAAVSGGTVNTSSGFASMVPGGEFNTAAGDFSFAAGLRAKAAHQGAFVWADTQSADFTSTANDQFLIRAQGGVGIGNNNPQAPLHVAGGGDAGLSSGGNIISGLVSGQNLVVDNNEIISRNNGAASDLVLNFGSGNVGIGRSPTANRLEVAGEASKAAAGGWLANSDARIKTGVQTVTNALDKLSRVRLVQFRYTDDYRAAHPGVEDREYLNVVAQEFQKVFPDDVKHSGEKLANGDDILQVDTYPLTIYSAAAIQELNQELKEKSSRIIALEKELSELKQAVKKLSDRKD